MIHSSSRRNFLKSSAIGAAGAFMFDKKTDSKHIRLLHPPPGKLNVVCVGAHPGDPEFGCGGTMARYSDAGHNVTFLYLTRGEAGDPTKTYEQSAALRTKEAEEACRALKVTPKFAGQIDGNTVVSNEKNEQMLKLLQELQPHIVFTHWPVDAHMDHQASGLLTLTAWVRMKKKFDLYFYEVNSGSETMGFSPTDYVDITSVQQKKHEAMFAHKTQDPQTTYDTFFKAMETFRGLEAGVKAAEAFIHFNGENRLPVIG
jgi:LmbE family N-acetylglucosaminyl deacetylase